MQVAPVIDLKQGQVVRGVGGLRDTYAPIVSRLATGSAPADIAAALRSFFPFEEIYIADLDAIGGAEPDWDSYRAIARTGCRLLIDAGARQLPRLVAFVDRLEPAGCVVLGLESVASPAALAEAWSLLPAERAIFSMDLFEGRLWNDSPCWEGYDLASLFERVRLLGGSRFIVLELSRVGRNGGPLAALAPRDQKISLRPKEISYTSVVVAAGGGVRGLADLQQLHQAGYSQALVASALHDGRLSPGDLSAALAWGES
ncbi:1-(5-phosphoribosyl)-5-[(5-phosphoribosylamino)methylideneamino] imidazole-4-carboxamide isomerase [Lignipirellula cremea]|uniref:1-(5-phosphoribosyl)-5-[(5-phosphoribosylamino)methylideneamino] imidazole-4-carboxamide isomerase n=2 Tax=Lignipirellula cremea TaxID=2528010 RepID=A0A518DZL7_9BACT|nr:1-(5-phosphoribosyl)-5-[(5-phosphoribosylamino)methylideneamino] imidazole-4-carboxamide isomerase [Lignipirellula cremea]